MQALVNHIVLLTEAFNKIYGNPSLNSIAFDKKLVLVLAHGSRLCVSLLSIGKQPGSERFPPPIGLVSWYNG